jgi:hypothetical protein
MRINKNGFELDDNDYGNLIIGMLISLFIYAFYFIYKNPQ